MNDRAKRFLKELKKVILKKPTNELVIRDILILVKEIWHISENDIQLYFYSRKVKGGKDANK